MAFVAAHMGDGKYVIDLEKDGQGQIADVNSGVLYPVQKMGSIAAHGHAAYWNNFKPGEVDLDGILARVKPQE